MLQVPVRQRAGKQTNQEKENKQTNKDKQNNPPTKKSNNKKQKNKEIMAAQEIADFFQISAI